MNLKKAKLKLLLLSAVPVFSMACSFETSEPAPIQEDQVEEQQDENSNILADDPQAPKNLREKEDPDKQKNLKKLKNDTPAQPDEVNNSPFQKERDHFIKLANGKRIAEGEDAYKEINYYHEFAQKIAEVKGAVAIWPEGESFQSYVARQQEATKAIQKLDYEKMMYEKYGEEFQGFNVNALSQTTVTVEGVEGSSEALASQAFTQASEGYLSSSTAGFPGDTLGVGVHCVTEVWRNTKTYHCTFAVVSGNRTQSHEVGELSPEPEEPFCPATPASLGTGSYKIGKWKASYFANQDFKYSEYLNGPSINYIYGEFHPDYPISSHDFRATWETEIQVTGTDQLIAFDYYLSWSTAKIWVNDKLIVDTNSSKPHQHLFKVGSSRIKIEAENNWHTTMFNFRMKQHPKLELCQVKRELEKIVNNETEALYVGLYESTERYNQIKVRVKDHEKPVVLFLSSYSPVNYVIDNPYGVDIKAVVYGSYSGGTTFHSNYQNVFEVKGLKYSSDDTSEVFEQIKDIMGKEPMNSFVKYETYELSI